MIELNLQPLSPSQRSVGVAETFKPLITLLVPMATSLQPSLSRDILKVISLTLQKILLLLLPQEISRVLGAPSQKIGTKYTFFFYIVNHSIITLKICTPLLSKRTQLKDQHSKASLVLNEVL